MSVGSEVFGELLRTVLSRVRLGLSFRDALLQVDREQPELVQRAMQAAFLQQAGTPATARRTEGFAEIQRPGQERLIRLAEEKMNAEKLCFRDALLMVCREHPELAAIAHQETLEAR
jgi:hypothetical protein